MPTERILAIDPAARTGWAYRYGCDTPLYGVWEISLRTDDHPGERLRRLRDVLVAFCQREPSLSLIAYEDAHYGTHNHDVAAMHAELRGVIRLVAADHNVPVFAIGPSSLKKFATGHGKAKKDQMIRAAKTLLGIETDDDNIADALFLLEYARQRQRLVTPKPKRRRTRKTSPQGRLFK